jgi:hypothetical protein
MAGGQDVPVHTRTHHLVEKDGGGYPNPNGVVCATFGDVTGGWFGRMRTGHGRENGFGPPARLVSGGYYWTGGAEEDLVICKHRGKEIVFRGSGTPDQLRGNPLIPVIENTTLGRRPALPRLV